MDTVEYTHMHTNLGVFYSMRMSGLHIFIHRDVNALCKQV